MPACPSCGANNAPEAEACAYCGNAVVARKELDVAWEAQAGEGVRAKGSATVEAPAATGIEQVRAQVQAAFSATLDRLGASASRSAVEGALREQLAELLPSDHRLTALSVTDLEVTSAATALWRTCVFMAVAGFSLFCLLTAWLMSVISSAGARAATQAATPMTVAEAKAAPGSLALLEAVVADVASDQAVQVPGKPDPYVAKATGDATPTFADAFQIGGLPAFADSDARLVSHIGGKMFTQVDAFSVIAPGDALTVVGQVEDGRLRVRVAAVPVPPRALREALQASANTDRVVTIVPLLFALLLPLLFWKSRTLRRALRL